jgi:hypothetical protein
MKCCVSSRIRSAMANRDDKSTNAAVSPLREGVKNVRLGDNMETRRGVSARRAAKRMRMAVRAMGRLCVVA